MCRSILFLFFSLALSSACWSLEPSAPRPGQLSQDDSVSAKQQALNLVDSLLTDNDNLKKINDDDKKSLEAQGLLLKSYESLFKSIGLENEVLRWTAGGAVVIAVAEAFWIILK